MNVLALFFALLFRLSISTYLSIIKSEANKSHGFSIDLIHRDSPLSPFHNSSKTQSELLQNAALRSVSRSKRLRHLQTSIVPVISDGSYVMRLYIGTPPVETWAVADTGSDLLWVQCLPCTKCYPQDAPLFDPKRSSTYKTVSCHSETCKLLPQGHDCGKSKQCVYNYGYVDDSETVGELARDVINFGGVSFPESVFGCGHKNTGEFSSEESGVVGLGNGPFSLVSQLGPEIGHKFSYCLVPFFSNSASKLKLGEEAKISGSKGVVSTPFITRYGDPFYILNLEGITIGQKTVRISSEDGGGNMVIDSGSTLTHLTSSFYKKVEAVVREAIGIEAVKNPPKPYSLCFAHRDFASQVKKKLNGFVVHFKGADISLNPDHNLFVQNLLLRNRNPNLFCFAMVPIEDGAFSVYGDVAQINFEVEYDLEARKVSFAPADCTNH